MQPSSSSSWWSRLWRKPDAPVEDDAGDMGTAFGMEMTLNRPSDPKDKRGRQRARPAAGEGPADKR